MPPKAAKPKTTPAPAPTIAPRAAAFEVSVEDDDGSELAAVADPDPLADAEPPVAAESWGG
jgi:hypothetical protein